MAALSEIGTAHIIYAGRNRLRREFLTYAVPDAQVTSLAGDLEIKAYHPISVAQAKIASIKKGEAFEPTDCFVAFDTLTYVPTQGCLVYEARGKPSSKADVLRLFWELRKHESVPQYRIRSASVLWCGDHEKNAFHDATISLSPHGLARLTSDQGFDAYTAFVHDFGYQFHEYQSLTDISAGLHLEALFALGCVEAIDGMQPTHVGFVPRAQRAIFLATVGASHHVLQPITHNPMGHILEFPYHRDRLALLNKYTGAVL